MKKCDNTGSMLTIYMHPSYVEKGWKIGCSSFFFFICNKETLLLCKIIAEIITSENFNIGRKGIILLDLQPAYETTEVQ